MRNKAYTLDTKKEAKENLEEVNEELKGLIEKYNIKVNTDDTLYFKQMIKMRSKTPNFFYEFKKHRTHLTKEKEPEKKEHYHIEYLRMREKEQKELEKKKKKEEERQAKEAAIIHDAEVEAKKQGSGSNTVPAMNSGTDRYGTGRTEGSIPVDITHGQ